MISRRTPVRAAAVGFAVLLAAAPLAAGAEEFFKLEELTPDVTLEGRDYYIPTIFGPTGMNGWILGEYLVVREVDKGSPADGRILPNDVLYEANGRALGDEPLKTLGEQIGGAEQTGKLTLGLIRGGRKQQTALRIPKLGALGRDWPVNCPKSRKILEGACGYLASIQNFDGGFDNNTTVAWAMAGLTWLGSDDPAYLENLRRMIYCYIRENRVQDRDNPTWGWGYMGTLLAEYYFRTGDRAAAPALLAVADALAKSQGPPGTWGHGAGVSPGYVQGGYLNAAGSGCWLALVLLKECGARVDELALAKADRFFTRFADRGGVPYGNHRPEFFTTGNSKDALAGLAHAAKGNREAAEVVGRMVTDGYRDRNKGHTGGFLGFVWGNVAGLNNPHRPDYHRMLDYWTWFLDVSRRWDGGFLMPGTVTGNIYTYRGPLMSTGGVGMTYAAATKALRIFGAPKSVFADRDLSPTLRQAVRLYRDLNFGELRKTVKPDSDLARQLLQAADRKEKDIRLSLRKAERAIAEGNPVLARRIAEDLDMMCAGKCPEARKLLEDLKDRKYAPVFAAAKPYEKHRLLADTRPEARKAMEKIAGDPKAGIYRKLAAEVLARPPKSSDWLFLCEVLWRRYSDDWKTNLESRCGMQWLAVVKGGYWPQWAAEAKLREAGFITDDYLKEWTALLPATGAPGPDKAPEWRYHARKKDESPPPGGWTAAGFDDSAWKKGKGPVTRARGKPLQLPRGTVESFIRIAFEADKIDFSKWKLYLKVAGHRPKTVVYLNGKPLAWVNPGKGKTLSVDLDGDPAKFLTRGMNVLAARFTASDFDIGLYAQK